MDFGAVTIFFVGWTLAGVAFCALWAYLHRSQDHVAAAKRRVEHLVANQSWPAQSSASSIQLTRR